jgi:hypothetical protein
MLVRRRVCRFSISKADTSTACRLQLDEADGCEFVCSGATFMSTCEACLFSCTRRLPVPMTASPQAAGALPPSLAIWHASLLGLVHPCTERARKSYIILNTWMYSSTQAQVSSEQTDPKLTAPGAMATCAVHETHRYTNTQLNKPFCSCTFELSVMCDDSALHTRHLCLDWCVLLAVSYRMHWRWIIMSRLTSPGADADGTLRCCRPSYASPRCALPA